MKAANPKLRAFTFINRADPRGTDNDDTREVLRENQTLEFLDTPLGTRKAFSNAAAGGLAVTELHPLDAKAHDEILALYRYVFNISTVSSIYRKRSA